MSGIIWGAVLRMIQALLQGSPFIFTGLCIAGALSRLLGPAHTRTLFGSNSVSSLFQSWVIGMLLPGCSLGVIPVCKQLRASGIAIGTIFAFALSSPLFDPLSLLYGLTLSKPFTILAFACCSLVVVTVAGSIFDRLFPDTEVHLPAPPAAPPGIKRILAVVVDMARETVGLSAALIGIGLVGVGLLAVLLPAGALQRSMAHENVLSPLVMTGVAIPAYATPMTVMSQLGSMFQHGNSVGAAFILLTFGAGMNLGLLAWMWLHYGGRKLAIWIFLMIAVALGLSYGIERPLYPTEIEPANHTHAFDRYCAPFHADAPPSRSYPAEIAALITTETQTHEWVGVAMLGLLALVGGVLKAPAVGRRVDAWLVAHTGGDGPPAAAGRYDLVVPGPVLVVIGIAVIVAASAVGCFAYYPAPNEALSELSVCNTEAVQPALGGDAAAALQWIAVCESWNNRLVVGAYLRHGTVSDYHLAKSRLYRDRLEFLEHALEDHDDPEEIRAAALAASRAAMLLARAFREQPIR
jgi:uncharacterized membrane protein YraQ (UPF0718 family)